jgi:hypothetical protein
MKIPTLGLAALLVAGLSSPLVGADPWYQPCYPCIPKAPDACGPGFYAINSYGGLYGPNYCLRLPCLPPNGLRPLPVNYVPPIQSVPAVAAQYRSYGFGVPCYPVQPAACPGPGPGPAILAIPTHPFARGPRDYFMAGQTMNDF